MHRWNRWIVVALTVALPGLAACAHRTELPSEAAQVDARDASGISRLRLTDRAVKRLGLETSAVRAMSGTKVPRMTIPYAAVLYDVNGDAWTYTSPEPLMFVRHRITVDYIEGDTAVLVDGPPLGTAVVTVGAAELYGAEFEFQEE